MLNRAEKAETDAANFQFLYEKSCAREKELAAEVERLGSPNKGPNPHDVFESGMTEGLKKAAEQAESALTRARAEVTEFEKAKAYISGDRLGSYTLYGQWTLTANLTIEEMENSRYRTALERGRAEGMEAAAVIAETISMPSFGSDAKWDGYEMATEDIASAIRLAKDKI